MTLDQTSITTTGTQTNGPNQIQTRNRIEVRQGWKAEERRKRSDTTGHQSPNTGTHKEGEEEMYCLLSCRIRLGTIHSSYPWIGNSYNSSSIRERIVWFPSDDTIIDLNTNRLLFIVSSYVPNTIIYNNHQQQKKKKKKKENDKELHTRQ